MCGKYNFVFKRHNGIYETGVFMDNTDGKK